MQFQSQASRGRPRPDDLWDRARQLYRDERHLLSSTYFFDVHSVRSYSRIRDMQGVIGLCSLDAKSMRRTGGVSDRQSRRMSCRECLKLCQLGILRLQSLVRCQNMLLYG